MPVVVVSAHSTTKENALVEDEQRTFDEEMGYIKQISPCCYTIKKGCVPNMKVSAIVLYTHCTRGTSRLCRTIRGAWHASCSEYESERLDLIQKQMFVFSLNSAHCPLPPRRQQYPPPPTHTLAAISMLTCAQC